jgi:undecaprenyl-diphosphatase
MSFIEAIVLGLVQGLTEFLPISSSAHLRLVGEFLPSQQDPGATFTAITQLGTEAAVIIYFWKDITRIIGRWFRSFGTGRSGSTRVPKNDPDVRLGWLIIIGTIPIVLVGYFAQEAIRTSLRSLWITAFVLIGFGLLLGLADYLGRKARPLDQMKFGHGIAVGFAEILALVPGVSRSGATTTAALALGYTRPAAARFSFLLAIPAVFGSGLYELQHSFSEPAGAYGYAETAIATLIAFVVGYVVIAYLMKYISTHSFMPFVVYRVVLGLVIIGLLTADILQPA